MNDPIDLMTECTICETLASADAPTPRALGLSRPYGALVGDFLIRQGMLTPGSRIIELGGGYGSLMKGLLDAHGSMVHSVIMADLSRHLVGVQRRHLAEYGRKIFHVVADIHELPFTRFPADLVLVNEVMGDLDTVTDLDASELAGEIDDLVRGYGLDVPRQGTFHLNIGAIRLVEDLCRLGPACFLTEHACDPVVPEHMPYLANGMDLDSCPRRIDLQGHAEYTIRFSHLVKVARALGREVRTGPLVELLGLAPGPSWRFIFTARACATHGQSCVYEFLDHVREYRWITIS